jgi:RNA polymerase sigma factor (sigma-70 family)
MTNAETNTLILRAQSGDIAARNAVVVAHMGLVGHVLRQYRSQHQDRADLMQIGALALMHAIGKFDVSRHLCLSTYASWWIWAGFQRWYRTTGRGVVVPPVDAPGSCANVAILSPGQPGQGIRDGADLLGIDYDTPEVLYESRDRIARCRSEVLGCHEWTPLQRDIIERRLLNEDPDTLDALARDHGVSRERIRQRQVRVEWFICRHFGVLSPAHSKKQRRTPEILMAFVRSLPDGATHYTAALTRDRNNTTAAIRIWGSWDAALRVAGRTPRRLRAPQQHRGGNTRRTNTERTAA